MIEQRETTIRVISVRQQYGVKARFGNPVQIGPDFFPRVIRVDADEPRSYVESVGDEIAGCRRRRGGRPASGARRCKGYRNRPNRHTKSVCVGLTRLRGEGYSNASGAVTVIEINGEGMMKLPCHYKYLFAICLPPALYVFGCNLPGPAIEDDRSMQMMALLLPNRIEIVEPFTRVADFDGDGRKDGIELLVQAINALDNPGLMLVGHVRVELFTFVAASAEIKGQRLEQWEIELVTTQQQRTHWNAMTQMYEFKLGIDPKRIPAAEKYVVAVTYRSPLGDSLADEFVIEYPERTGSAPAAMPGGGR